MLKNIKNKDLSFNQEIWDETDNNIKDFISLLLEKNPKKRINA